MQKGVYKTLRVEHCELGSYMNKVKESTSTDSVELRPINVTSAVASDIGRVRNENQDSYGANQTEFYNLFVVADGMGGVEGGAIASKLAIKTFIESLHEHVSEDELRESLKRANQAVFIRGQEDEQLAGMGTTFVAMCFTAHETYLLHVGDSRAYRFRQGALEQLTRDHTLVQELVDSGALRPEQVENHPVSHMLTRSLGPSQSVEPDCKGLSDYSRSGDRYLLCSDGLYNHVRDGEIAEILSSKRDSEAVKTLVALANERGGTDNITVLIVSVCDGAQNGHQDQRIPISESGGVSEQTNSSTFVGKHVRSPLSTEKLLFFSVLALGMVSLLFLIIPFFMKSDLAIRPGTAHLAQSLSDSIETISEDQKIAPSRFEAAITAAEGIDLLQARESSLREQKEDTVRYIEFFEHDQLKQKEQLNRENNRRENKELDRVRIQIERATRKLAVWHQRKKDSEGKGALAVAIEVAAVSDAVRSLKLQFDQITWKYLRKMEALRYEPDNIELKEQLLELQQEREQALLTLSAGIRDTIKEEGSKTEAEVAELIIRKDALLARLTRNIREREILTVLIDGSASERKALREELEAELRVIESEQAQLKPMNVSF